MKQQIWMEVTLDEYELQEDEDDEEKSKDYSICHIMHLYFHRL